MKTFVVLVISLTMSLPLWGENLRWDKYCRAKSQSLQAHQMMTHRLARTVDFHNKAYFQFKTMKQDQMANVHKQYHHHLQNVLNQRQHYLKKEQLDYNADCQYRGNDAKANFDYKQGDPLLFI